MYVDLSCLIRMSFPQFEFPKLNFEQQKWQILKIILKTTESWSTSKSQYPICKRLEPGNGTRVVELIITHTYQ